MPSLRRLLPIALSALAASIVLPAAAQVDTPKAKEWKVSVAVGPTFALGKAADTWAKRAVEHSGGTLAVVVHPGASLAQRDPEREFAALRDGAADLAVGSTLHWAAQVEALAVVGLPWLAPDTRSLSQLTTGEVKDRLFAAVERAGAAPLALAPLGHRAIAARAKAIRVPDDLRGQRIRISPVRYLVDFYAGLGALPQAMPFADAAAAFRAGSLDAQEGPVPSFAAARLDALGLTHVTLWGAVAEIAVFAVNRAVWEGWSATQRAIVADAARDAANELAQQAAREEQAALAALRGRDTEFLQLTGSGTSAFAAAARPTYDKWAAIAGAEIVRAAEAAITSAR